MEADDIFSLNIPNTFDISSDNITIYSIATQSNGSLYLKSSNHTTLNGKSASLLNHWIDKQTNQIWIYGFDQIP